VKENFERDPFVGIDSERDPFVGLDSASDITPIPVVITPEKPGVTLKDIQELEEKQKKNLKAHLIALDMKEQGRDACHVSWRSPEIF
jgi:hypothetical protein